MPTSASQTRQYVTKRAIARVVLGVAALALVASVTDSTSVRNDLLQSPAMTQMDATPESTSALLVPRRIRLIIGYRKTRTA